MAVGILGGAFDPPHLGHVALGRAAIRELSLDELLVLVVANPGHREVAAPPETRLELAVLAFADIPEAAVELDHHPRTVDFLEERRFGDPLLILGADELAALDSWKSPERVLELARVAVAMRPGVAPAEVDAVRERLGVRDRIVAFEMSPVDVSSTDIRDRVARGQPLDDLVSPTVAIAITRLGLYRDAESRLRRSEKDETPT